MKTMDVNRIMNELLNLKKELAQIKFFISNGHDLEFIKRTEEAWRAHDRGEFISVPVDEFLTRLEKC